MAERHALRSVTVPVDSRLRVRDDTGRSPCTAGADLTSSRAHARRDLMRSTLSIGGSFDGRLLALITAVALIATPTLLGLLPPDPEGPVGPQIGRASCRE